MITSDESRAPVYTDALFRIDMNLAIDAYLFSD